MTRSRLISTPVNITDVESLRPGSPIFIAWIDAHHVADHWLDLDHVPADQCRVHSLGFYITTANEQIIYAADWVDKDEDEIHVNSVSAIPLGCIKEVTVLEVSK